MLKELSYYNILRSEGWVEKKRWIAQKTKARLIESQMVKLWKHYAQFGSFDYLSNMVDGFFRFNGFFPVLSNEGDSCSYYATVSPVRLNT